MRVQLINDFIKNQIQQIHIEYDCKIKNLEYKIVELTRALKDKEDEKNKEIDRLKQQQSIQLEKANSIRWIEGGKYYNLSDFCKMSKYIFFIKETELKQWLFQQGHLTNTGGKYIPSKDSDVCKIHNEEIYIQYKFIRETIVTLRSFVYIGDSTDIERLLEKYIKNKPTLIEQMANTVYVECKQRSEEFKEYKENKYFVESKEKESIR